MDDDKLFGPKVGLDYYGMTADCAGLSKGTFFSTFTLLVVIIIVVLAGGRESDCN